MLCCMCRGWGSYCLYSRAQVQCGSSARRRDTSLSKQPKARCGHWQISQPGLKCLCSFAYPGLPSPNPTIVSTRRIVFGWSLRTARIRQVLAGAREPHVGGKRLMPAPQDKQDCTQAGGGRQERTGVSGAADTKSLLSCPPCLRGQSPPSREEPSD